MKKTLFAITIALLLQTITLLVFFLPDSIIYVKQPGSTLHTWANIWGNISIFIMCMCTMEYYIKLGEKLFDYLKKD